MNKERLRLSISFREEYRPIYEHLLKQPNRSDYICRILQKEIEHNKCLEEKIDNLLSIFNDNRTLSNPFLLSSSTTKGEQELQNEDIDLLNTLF
ncbi:hypothetical protein SAMN05880501_11750 [Ureibacillus xyleni]|uniref:Uncharacterized protein n=1 Tax=Ureibacillus xyleni TaxID=614648 RepID=A0A285TP07_9BACL|nr:hypothetical protein [Ureibacillus xyleni]SOC24534.1 hypothetical protein SAMN05880501_11750 [Ureibacillus xyleni]